MFDQRRVEAGPRGAAFERVGLHHDGQPLLPRAVDIQVDQVASRRHAMALVVAADIGPVRAEAFQERLVEFHLRALRCGARDCMGLGRQQRQRNGAQRT
ncbi:hypothetical protein D3C72_1765230 [compost metagenome]